MIHTHTNARSRTKQVHSVSIDCMSLQTPLSAVRCHFNTTTNSKCILNWISNALSVKVSRSWHYIEALQIFSIIEFMWIRKQVVWKSLWRHLWTEKDIWNQTNVTIGRAKLIRMEHFIPLHFGVFWTNKNLNCTLLGMHVFVWNWWTFNYRMEIRSFSSHSV